MLSGLGLIAQAFFQTSFLFVRGFESGRAHFCGGLQLFGWEGVSEVEGGEMYVIEYQRRS
jgi:hypothetical protein